jgi:hypothetical protein
MKLERYEHNGLELVIDLDTGEVYASQSATARMCKVTETTIRKFVSSNQYSPLMTEIPTAVGLRSSSLLDEDFIHKCISKYNPVFLVECSKCGLRVYLHQLAGFQVTSTALQPKDSIFERLLISIDSLSEKIDRKEDKINSLVEKIQNQDKQMKSLLPIIEEHSNMKPSLDFMEELKPLLLKVSKELTEHPNQEYKTIKQWLEYSGLPALDRGKNIAIGQMVIAFYKMGNLKPLMKPEYRGSNKYPQAFLPVIKHAYTYTLFNR